MTQLTHTYEAFVTAQRAKMSCTARRILSAALWHLASNCVASYTHLKRTLMQDALPCELCIVGAASAGATCARCNLIQY
jgi:hypothetical protein